MDFSKPKLRLKKINDIVCREVNLVQGDEALAYGALYAGCSVFAGYPITPATETAEVLARLMPRAGGTFVQMEDEIASMAAIIGASWAGARSMTATSGPGYSLMMENLGYGCMTEAPCVVVNVQRSGPSTGQPTEPAQGDVMQTRWGSHGDYRIIALSPNSVQECQDLTIKAFALAEKYRNPVVVLTDGEVGHMRERLEPPTLEAISFAGRKMPSCKPSEYLPFADTDGDGVPPMAVFGSGYHTYVTGLTHRESGLPTTDDAAAHAKLVTRICDKIDRDADALTDLEEQMMEDADVAVVSFGITSRVALNAVRGMREQGIKAGYLRLRTIWPFPENRFKDLGQQVKAIVVPEMNLGQLVHVIREVVPDRCVVASLPSIGGAIHHPHKITATAQEALNV